MTSSALRLQCRELLIAVGEDLDRDGLRDTPKRVARSYAELLGGYCEDPGLHLERQFSIDHNEMVVVRDNSCSISFLPRDPATQRWTKRSSPRR